MALFCLTIWLGGGGRLFTDKLYKGADMSNLLNSLTMALQNVYKLGEKSEIKNFSDFETVLNTIFKNILGPVFVVIGVAAVIYSIVLGINYAKAEDADARKKVQGRLIGALIGAVIIIAGATLCFALQWEKILKDFYEDNTGKDLDGTTTGNIKLLVNTLRTFI